MKTFLTVVGLLTLCAVAFVGIRRYQKKHEVTIVNNGGNYSAAEVATHNSNSNCWVSINNEVYDLTAWISKHPGGPDKIEMLCGKDGSSLYDDEHSGQEEPAEELNRFKIGTLVN